MLAGYVFPQNKKIRLLIFAQGRTGSTLLESLLCSTGYFSKQGEILGIYHHVLFGPLDFVNGYAKLKKGDNFLFHAKIYQLITPDQVYKDPEKFVHTLYRKGWKVIFLHRTNTAKQVISSQIADARKVWHRIKSKDEDFQYTLDLNLFQEELIEREKLSKTEWEIMSKIPHLNLNYEEALSQPKNHQQTIADVLKFLELEPVEAKTNLRKTTDRSLSEVLTNYSEYRQLLLEKGWEKFLDE